MLQMNIFMANMLKVRHSTVKNKVKNGEFSKKTKLLRSKAGELKFFVFGVVNVSLL